METQTGFIQKRSHSKRLADKELGVSRQNQGGKMPTKIDKIKRRMDWLKFQHARTRFGTIVKTVREKIGKKWETRPAKFATSWTEWRNDDARLEYELLVLELRECCDKHNKGDN